MEKRRRSPAVDQKMFDCVKILLASGAKHEEIMKYTGLSEHTICRIRQAENFTEYRNIIAAMAAKNREYEAAKKAKAEAAKKAEEKKPEPEPEKTPEPEKQPEQVVEHRQSVTVQTTYYVTQKLDKLVELMTGISAKLAFIVDELTGVPVKKEG